MIGKPTAHFEPLDGGLGDLSGIMSAPELNRAKFTTLHFTGKWRRLIGLPTTPFKVMFYGLPGSGKSSFSLQFANYLAKSLKMSVLYVASEEGLTATMADKLKRFGVDSPNVFLTDKLPEDLSLYDVVFIDSVNHAGLEPEDLRELDASKSYVYVFQSTKDGKFRGSNDFLHDVDVCVKVDKMIAVPEKNRFGGRGAARVID